MSKKVKNKELVLCLRNVNSQTAPKNLGEPGWRKISGSKQSDITDWEYVEWHPVFGWETPSQQNLRLQEKHKK